MKIQNRGQFNWRLIIVIPSASILKLDSCVVNWHSNIDTISVSILDLFLVFHGTFLPVRNSQGTPFPRLGKVSRAWQFRIAVSSCIPLPDFTDRTLLFSLCRHEKAYVGNYNLNQAWIFWLRYPYPPVSSSPKCLRASSPTCHQIRPLSFSLPFFNYISNCDSTQSKISLAVFDRYAISLR